MIKYYVPEINLRDIRNKNNIIEKFENIFNKKVIEEKRFISNDGFYKLENYSLIKYKLIEKKYIYFENFLPNFSLIGLDFYNKKIGETFSIPHESHVINFKQIKFNIGNSLNFIVFEIHKNKIIDIYFLSNKKLDEESIFFKNDVSLFIEMLMSN